MRLAAGIAALLSALCFATAALAHATLVAAEPADGAVVAQAPKMVHLRFNEAVTPAVINLIDAEGKTRDDITSHVAGPSVFVTLPETLPRGTQIVSYRVVSQDGHPVAGSLLFSIGEVTRETSGQARIGPLAVLIWLARIGVYLGLFVGVGGVFFAAWIGRSPDGARIITGALGVGLFSAVASLGLQGLDLQNLPPSALTTLEPWKGALSTSLGPSMLIAVAVMAIAGFAWRSPAMTIAWALSAIAMAGSGLALATSGHAATAAPQWLSRPLVFFHGVGVAYWVGALVPLAVMARRRSSDLLRALRWFSAGALPIVGLVALTGLTLAAVQLQNLRALVDTSYGVILLVKLTLVIVMLGFAALNRFFVTPALAADADGDTTPLLGSVLIECVLAVAILAVVAGWRFTPPPRALAAAPSQAPLAIHIHTDAAMFQVLISPGKVGTDNFVLQLMNGDASPLEAKEVTLTLSLPERTIEGLERKATLGRDGYWHVRDIVIPLPGRWHMRIEALVTDFQKVTLEDDFELR
jgi:copper transport protein